MLKYEPIIYTVGRASHARSFLFCGEQMSLATVRCFAEYIALLGAELALSNYSNDTESSNYDSTTIGFQNFLGESKTSPAVTAVW